MANDYPLIGPPSIDLRTFQAILINAHSPAAGEAPAMYAAIMRYGVDPAVVLAIAQHESGFGKAGIAIGRDNLTGSRYYPGVAAFGATNRGGWAAFPTYAASAAYTASLLANSSYAGAGYTARTFPQRYAPASDGNDPRAYGTAVVNAINGWRGAPPAAAAHGRPTGTGHVRKAAPPKGHPKGTPAHGVNVGAAVASPAFIPLAMLGLAGMIVLVILTR